jgi:hypothetical protein
MVNDRGNIYLRIPSSFIINLDLRRLVIFYVIILPKFIIIPNPVGN